MTLRCLFANPVLSPITNHKVLLTETKPRPESASSRPRKTNRVERMITLHETGEIDYAQSFRAGQLEMYYIEWQKRGAPPHILQIIKGYRIPFVEKPPLARLHSKLCPVQVSKTMTKEIQKMIDQSVLEKAPDKVGFLSPMFLTQKQDGSNRPILNLKNLNRFIKPKKFRLINMYKVPQFLQPGDWMLKIDLSQAYFHVPIASSLRRFLKIAFGQQILQMTCLPFGLSSAPKAFASLTNWVAQKLREDGLRILVYLDDFLLVNQCPQMLVHQARLATTLLRTLGWVINEKKSSRIPAQQIEFLGIIWDTYRNKKCLPTRKLSTLHHLLLKIVHSRVWSILDLQRTVGWLNFASFVVPYGRLHHRNVLKQMQEVVKTETPAVPSELALLDLNWWFLNYKNKSPIWPAPASHYIITDASGTGWGAYVDERHLQGLWTQKEQTLHANLKELLVIYLVLKKMAFLFKHQTVSIQSDNCTALAYLRNQGGTRSIKLMELTRQIFEILSANKIHVITNYIPGPLNGIADSLSRGKSPPEWFLLPQACEKIFSKWGVPAIDLFASEQAHVVQTYVSRDLRDKQATFTDAFSKTWNFQMAWVFPPPSLMHKVLAWLNQARGTYIVICPRWNNVFWRSDLKARALSPPFTILNLKNCLIDTRTKSPPPQVDSLVLEAWLTRGGTTS
ncbi:hypothetical protein O0L34_g19463 [Tuta absoluta]|nr:hypothetical protein O0L34_g19463 [Tuta absoluta]